jgi:hypothetical protein
MGRDLRNGWHQVIGERNRLRLPGAVIHEFLEQRGPSALRCPAGDLPFDQHRVDRAADIVATTKKRSTAIAALSRSMSQAMAHSTRLDL